jgi:hypothetical protein
MQFRSALRRHVIRFHRKQWIWKKRILAGLLALLLILLLSRWRLGGPPATPAGHSPAEKLRVIGKINSVLQSGEYGRLIEVLPTSGSFGVVTARIYDRAGRVEQYLRGCLAVETAALEQVRLPATVYLDSCPADWELQGLSLGNSATKGRSSYTVLELWKHALRSSPQESIWRKAETGECIGLNANTLELTLGNQNCIVWDARKNATLFRDQIRLTVASPAGFARRYRAKGATTGLAGCTATRCPPDAASIASRILPWHFEPLPLRLEAAAEKRTSHRTLALDPPLLDALSAVPLSSRARHRSTIGLVTVRRYAPISKFPVSLLNRSRFEPGSLPLMNPKDRTIRTKEWKTNQSTDTEPSRKVSGGTSHSARRSDSCLSVTDLAARKVDLLPCESNHDDPNGQHQVWDIYNDRVYTALSHELCLDAVTQRELIDCPARNASCGAVYATMASLMISLWRDPVYAPLQTADSASESDQEFIDKIHLFASGFPVDEEYLRVYQHNPKRIKIHRWDEQFRRHLAEAGAPSLEHIRERRHAAGTLNYYAALWGLHSNAPPERDLVLLEDDVKVADDAWVNMLSSLRSVEKDLNAMKMLPNRRYGFPENTSYALQLYVPEKWHRPRLGWQYAFLERSRIYGTQAFLYPSEIRQHMVEHYLRGITEARDLHQIPKYDLHLHYLDLPIFGLARSAFEHSGCASTGLGAGLHRSRTWTPCELLHAAGSGPAANEEASIRWSGWAGAKRNPGPLSWRQLSPDQRKDTRFYLVITDDFKHDKRDAASRPLVRYVSLSSALASAWADGPTMLDRVERIYLVGDEEVPIAHHQVVQMASSARNCILDAMTTALAQSSERDIFIFLQHQRPIFIERALAFPDGWFQRLEQVIEHLHSVSDRGSKQPSLFLLGLRGRLPNESLYASNAADAPSRLSLQDGWDASICSDLDMIIIAGIQRDQHHSLQDMLRSSRMDNLSQLCRTLHRSGQVALALLDDPSHSEICPILETF